MTRLPIVAAILSLVAGSFSLGSPAQAAPDASSSENTADVRCVIVALSLASSTDPQTKAIATAAGLYFVGRLRGRAPDLDMEAAIVKQASAFTGNDLRVERQRCGGELVAEGGRLKVIGDDLAARAKAGAAGGAATAN